MADGKIVSQTELGAILGVTPKTIREWGRQGLPIEESGRKGTANRYNTVDVISWLNERARQAADVDFEKIEETSSRRRKEFALMRHAELDLSERVGELVAVEAVGQMVTEEYSLVRGKINSIPGSVSSQLVGLTAAEIQEALADRIAEVLHGLTADEQFSAGPTIAEGPTRGTETAAPA